MRKIIIFVSFMLLCLVLVSCSGQEKSDSKSSGGDASNMEIERTTDNSEMSLNLTDSIAKEENLANSEQEMNDTITNKEGTTDSTERMVIYNADLHLSVKNYAKAQSSLEAKAAEYGGYIVESTTNRSENEQLSGMMIFRIPQEHFSAFLHDAEGSATKVINRHVSGQDVTEEFVDLESRRKSKTAVESRLLSFMKEADKTEDLLKISADLAEVQEEIEQLTGRIKFIQNQTALSTVTLTMDETSIHIPELDQQNLNTWENVKKQLAVNINWLLAALSGTVVLIAGNLPILTVGGLISAGIIIVLKRRRKNKRQ